MNSELEGIIDELKAAGNEIKGTLLLAAEEVLVESARTVSTVMITLRNNGQVDLADAVQQALVFNYKALEKVKSL